MVPLYDSLGPESISYVLAHSEITTCYCSESSIQTLSKTSPQFEEYYIIYDPVSSELEEQMKNRGIKIYQYVEFIAKGQENILSFPQINNEQIFKFSYTSGTTGNPKGVMITYKNMLGAVSNHQKCDAACRSIDIHFSYLPLPHIFEYFLTSSC